MSNSRPPVPRNVERQLWAESCGFCTNPDCQEKLIDPSANRNVGQMAHISPHSKGGSPSLSNLILLCANCHLKTEPLKEQDEASLALRLREWKKQAIERNEQRFALRLSSFDSLQEKVKPLLERNRQIFEVYGPNSNAPESRKLWLKFENELIANNSVLKCLLTANIDLFHQENKEPVQKFLLHVDEFVRTREDDVKLRQLLFPREILSMFGVERELSSHAPSVSALQNFVLLLKKQNKFIDLEFFPDPTLVYRESGELQKLHLNDRGRVQQIFFSRRLYMPHKTELRLESLVFFLDWLTRNKIKWEFEDYCDLTTLILQVKYRVKMFYSYCLSVSDLQKTTLSPGDYVVNLHMWNEGPSSSPAIKYAKSIGSVIYNQNQFFAFCHRKIK